MGSIDPVIYEATVKILETSTALRIDNYQAMEVYTRCLISVALDAANGDHVIAAAWIDKWLLPNIHHFRDALMKGGSTAPVVSDGKRLNS